MENSKVISLANRIHIDSVGKMPTYTTEQMYAYITAINDAVRNKGVGKLNKQYSWFKEWAVAWRRLCDRFDQEVEGDPFIIYQPAHDIARQFHASTAFVRYFRAGNRTGKTQTGVAEDWMVATNRHRWRKFPHDQHTIGVISFDFKTYVNNVFIKKFLEGEENNILSPLAPEQGRWFKRWSEKQHKLELACDECAAKWRPGFKPNCTHPGSAIQLFSAEQGVNLIEGFTARMIHIDEHVPEPFFNAARQRLMTADGSCMLVTATPLSGLEGWEYRKLAKVAEGPLSENQNVLPDGSVIKDIEMFQISQYDAGLSPKWKIDRAASQMDEFEREIRIYGRPAPLADNPVFNRRILQEQRSQLRDAERFVLEPKQMPIQAVANPAHVSLIPTHNGPLRIWEKPQDNTAYVIGADAAAGVSQGDYSCASVLKIEHTASGHTNVTLVAQWHGYCNVLEYADVLKLLGFYYNVALVVIELTGGHGRATMIRLKKEYFYPNIFLDTSAPEQLTETFAGRYGVDTNAYTKPAMIGALQHLVNNRLINLFCTDTMQELVAFSQEKTDSKLSVRYRGAGGSHDDRVMSLCIAVYVILTHPQMCFQAIAFKRLKKPDPTDENIINVSRIIDRSQWEQL